MNHFVRETLFGQLCRVTCRQAGELSIGELRSYNIEQLKALPFVKCPRMVLLARVCYDI